MVVDTGALYTVLPERVWRKLGLTSPVVLGERDDAPLLGAVTLETLGLMVNPLTREVRPMGPLPMYRALGSAAPAV